MISDEGAKDESGKGLAQVTGTEAQGGEVERIESRYPSMRVEKFIPGGIRQEVPSA